ncbi:unnamed protein product [Dovyalis caffra]|uniref:Uncharacterized protein n=1 Tax=Dovyalis caffra TaxID=77055 RepID=A0AAV1SCU4_9ROSI|nr:unnamed protein product [Dovyalis caffra]
MDKVKDFSSWAVPQPVEQMLSRLVRLGRLKLSEADKIECGSWSRVSSVNPETNLGS